MLLIKHVQVLLFLYDILVKYHTWYEYGTSSWEYCAMHDNIIRIKLSYSENFVIKRLKYSTESCLGQWWSIHTHIDSTFKKTDFYIKWNNEYCTMLCIQLLFKDETLV